MSAKGRRCWIHYPILVLWLGPGAYLSYVLKDSVPWVVFMSWFAIIYAVVGASAADLPSEVEGEE